ncbi:flagellar hook-basal body complex protein FliE [Aquifex aeolicus]|uniref:Flagellar hook-basal body complex protein FliE n=1 Tax=Aquifex aeolicus (strain VF5) TaxID=224324 RepID=FLIE_AQUAE|nr:flagellar hook-basal body complex protein FliE [Aquifex aeolicus]O67242.1 RecName: Full=Flagellar hook-basal body complex protein FliE [Aquifex aeolicus VF5]AAC07208.1 flagellar hook-basal body protein [Aquifex aeolicus VF5]
MEVGKLGFIPKLFEVQQNVKGEDIVENFVNFVEWVNEKQLKSKKLKEAVLEGRDVPLHEIVIEAEKAKVALNLLIEVRNKLLEAYNELMKMQV